MHTHHLAPLGGALAGKRVILDERSLRPPSTRSAPGAMHTFAVDFPRDPDEQTGLGACIQNAARLKLPHPAGYQKRFHLADPWVSFPFSLRFRANRSEVPPQT